jgi:hypothetical protein
LGNLKFVCGVRGFVWRLERLNPQIDLWRLEARRVDLEIEGYDVRKLLQNNRHFAIVQLERSDSLLSASISYSCAAG